MLIGFKWTKKCVFNIPTPLKATLNQSVVHIKSFTQLWKASGNSLHCNNPVAPKVSLLFLSSRPIAVFFAISSVVVSALYCEARRSFSHILKKVLKLSPTFANCDASTSVITVVRIGGICASSNHVIPSTKCWRGFPYGMTMSRHGEPSKLFPIATTGLGESTPEDCVTLYHHSPAFALANAVRLSFNRSGIFNYFKSSKNLADKRYSFWHGIAFSMLCFSSGRPATTGAHCDFEPETLEMQA